MYILSLAWKNISNRKSSAAIVIFISISMAILLFINAIFDGTETGIQKAFTRSFTGDFIIRPVSNMPLSLFGDETPVTGELSTLPQIIPYIECYKKLKEMENIAGFTPQITGLAQLQFNGSTTNAPLFGVSGTNYINLMSGITITEGKPFSDYEEGAMVSTALIKTLQQKTGKKINIGDKIQFTIADSSTFRIRSVPITAIYSYTTENSVLDRIVLVDHDTVRDLMGLKSSTAELPDIDNKNTKLLDFAMDDMSDLFSDATDLILTEESNSTILGAGSFNHVDNNKQPVDTSIPSIESETLWHYIICTVTPDANPGHIIRTLNKLFKQNDWPLEAVNWRTAAGSTAIYLYWLRMIFNIGVIVILLTGFLIVNNTLIINVMDRTKEIGTLQAIGAGKPFIVRLFLTETYILTLSSALFGILLGNILTVIISISNITFTNSYIIQLFGSTVLSPHVTISNILSILGLSILLGFLSWIAPVRIALQETPVSAMRGSK